jgi:two-component system LytT family response regulator
MKRIGIVVVDDIAVQRLLLRRLIEQHPALEWLGEANSGGEALEMIENFRPDVVILDVEMPGMSGFDVLNRLETPPKIVFASAWPAYAVDAFEMDAVDYLLKPIAPDRFAQTVLRLKRLFSNDEQPAVPLEPADRICLRTTERTFVVALNSLVFLKADGDFTWVHDARQPPILACRRIGELGETLPPLFVRLDRSLIINLDRLAKVERISRNAAQLWLHGSTESVEIGRTALARLQEITQRE